MDVIFQEKEFYHSIKANAKQKKKEWKKKKIRH